MDQQTAQNWNPQAGHKGSVSTAAPSNSDIRDGESFIWTLTVQLTAQELEAEGTATVAGNRVQPYVLCLQSGGEHVNLQAVVVQVTQKLLEEKE